MNGDNQGACVPCNKELLCSRMAAAMIETGHRLAETGEWREAELVAWNGLLDRFAADSKAMLMAGPLGADSGSSAPAAEDWREALRSSAAAFDEFVRTLPVGERDAAWKAGHDALDHLAAEIGARSRGFDSPAAELAAARATQAPGHGCLGATVVGG